MHSLGEISLSQTLPAAAQTPADFNRWNENEDLISFHLGTIHHQLQQAYVGMALAVAAGRGFILPKVRRHMRASGMATPTRAGDPPPLLPPFAAARLTAPPRSGRLRGKKHRAACTTCAIRPNPTRSSCAGARRSGTAWCAAARPRRRTCRSPWPGERASRCPRPCRCPLRQCRRI